MAEQIYSLVNTFIAAKKSGVLGTIVEGNSKTCPVGSKFLLTDTGDYYGPEGLKPLFTKIKDILVQMLKVKKPQVIEAVWEQASLKIFLDPICPQERLVILGGGHIALPLAVMAKLLGFQVTVIDDRPEFASGDRFPEADQTICQDFREAIRELAIDPYTYVIIVTRGHQYDKICLEEVLQKPQAGYVGMIGSKRKVRFLYQELALCGFDRKRLDSVYAPIGLDIGAQTPEEIALSIMAEVVMVRNYGFSQGMKLHQRGEEVGF